ncbi:hypothetical protein FC84_GL001421 [Lapidilactobacillus dextrinicus DSM 20335]|uniref:Uncharacterized protein n=1 Tax=Lapidilactobacillus dextrinicus DSM 20335 TaxID=1423738 RepID=A0A0R2BI82_9LACO|nr:DsrE family protein [Lapidilactobacillus dextrinicus]KRM79247.1 hypothetical protein FC84_GL001421 [Lapidilactobacillus dextrinicus DSM 20335]QFG46911.1 sulfur reduction protein DsrE [Lapidilactobacillus dextrinicus]
MKIVFHIDELEKWPVAQGNLVNTLVVPNIDMVVVVNGVAITGYLQPEVQKFIAQYQSQIAFHACHNAMQAHDITADQLSKGVKVVPAGIIDLVNLQNQGYRYIKP